MFEYTFQWKQALARLPQMLEGAVVTMEVALLSMGIGLLLAVLLTLLRLSGARPLQAIATTWVEIARNTPALFQIYMAHFGIASFGLHLSPFVSLLIGITFNNAYDTLYIGSFGAAAIYAMSISPDGVPGRVVVWADFSDTPGLLDGMGVDICGNVYVCEYGATDIWRVSPDGKTKKKIIIGGPYDTYLPNFQWGRGPGWDPLSLYIPDGWKIGVWRAQIGVPSKPLAFPPGE